MTDRNNCSFGGRLGKDPVTKKIPNGSTFTSFGLATNYWRNGGEQVLWLDCKLFGDVADRFNKLNFKKGYYIILDGVLGMRKWGDNNENISIELDVKNFDLTPYGKRDDEGGTAVRSEPAKAPERSEGNRRGNAPSRGPTPRSAATRAPEPPVEDEPNDDNWEDSDSEESSIPF